MSKLLELAATAEAIKSYSINFDVAVAGALSFWAEDLSVPAYSRSLDAAETLVPKGWDWQMDYTHGSEFQVAIVSCDPGPYCEGRSATLPLAICAAALKARAAQEQPE
jgi:hypothetical protein